MVACASQEFCVVSMAIFASTVSPVIFQAEARDICNIAIFLLIALSFWKLILLNITKTNITK